MSEISVGAEYCKSLTLDVHALNQEALLLLGLGKSPTAGPSRSSSSEEEVEEENPRGVSVARLRVQQTPAKTPAKTTEPTSFLGKL